jgi:hypothetical protein
MGIVVEHTEWNPEYGAFRVKWNKVYTPGKPIFFDRADQWVLVNGCDIR